MSAPIKCAHCLTLIEVDAGQSLQHALNNHYLDLHRQQLIDGTLTVSVIRAA